MDPLLSFGAWLRQRRRALDLTQEALADQVGCSLSAIRKIETDERRPSRQVAQLLAKVLAIPPAEEEKFLKVARAELRVERLATVEAPAPPTVAPRPAPPAPPSTAAPPLPIPPTPLVGRAAEVQQLAQLLHDPACRLLTVVGPGGVGKTRLALQVAATLRTAFADGVFFVALAAIQQVEYLYPTLAAAIGCPLQHTASPKAELADYLQSKALLLVLDNLEHLLAPVTATTPDEGVESLPMLIQQAPQLKLLLTSREPLNVVGEWLFDLQGLPLPATDQLTDLQNNSAVALLLESANRLQAGALTLSAENRAGLARICQLTEGMPLALELAASWLRTLSPLEIAQEIERSFDFLTSPLRDLPPRHRSLRATLDHSWRLLSAAEQQTLARLAVFAGGFDREGAERVADATLSLLAALVDKSLLKRTTGRYTFHELVRQYAAERLTASGEAAATRQRHARYFTELAEQAQLRDSTGRKQAWLTRFTDEHNNLRAALQWLFEQEPDPILALRLVAPLAPFWRQRGHWQEGRHWLERVLRQPLPPNLAPDQLRVAEILRAKALVGLADLYPDQYRHAQQYYEEALQLFRTHGEEWHTAFTMSLLGHHLIFTGDYVQAEEWLQAGLARLRALQDRWGEACTLQWLGAAAVEQGHFAQAIAYCTASLQIERTLGNDETLAGLLTILGVATQGVGETAHALQYFEEGLTLFRQQGSKEGVSWVLGNLGALWLEQGDSGRAAACFTEYLQLRYALASKGGIVTGLHGLGRAALLQGRTVAGVQLLAAADQFRQQTQLTIPPIYRAPYEQALATARTQLGDANFTLAWVKGERLSLDQAVAYALTTALTD